MATYAKRKTASGVAYILFGLFMLYIGLSAWGIIGSENTPKGNFVAISATAIALVDLAMGVRAFFLWTGSCPYCGFPKVTGTGDPATANCRVCKRKVLHQGGILFKEGEELHRTIL